MKSMQNLNETKTQEENKLLTNRLNRIIGQINGVKKMIEGGKPCADILIQTSAIISSLKSTQHAIFAGYFTSNVVDKIKNDDTAAITTALDMIKKL